MIVAEGAFHAAERVVVQRDLRVASLVGDHELDRVTVPRAVRRVLVVFVRHHEPEVHVVVVVDDLHRRGLIVRSRPSSSVVLLEEDQCASRRNVGSGSFGSVKAGIGQQLRGTPFGKIAVDHDRGPRFDRRVILFSGFNVVGLRPE